MINYIKNDPIRIVCFVIALVIGVFIAKSTFQTQEEKAAAYKGIFREAFVTATEQRISRECGREIALSEESRLELKNLFNQSITIENLCKILERDKSANAIVADYEDFSAVIEGLMNENAKSVYENFIRNAVKTANASATVSSSNP